MSATRGEGRAPAEKQQVFQTPGHVKVAQRAARKAEQEAWEARSGPVTVRQAKNHDGPHVRRGDGLCAIQFCTEGKYR